ncbi:hypothetical protein SAMN02745673_00659 [Marinactinospora thermotolerans DSM 45154]|uniref:Uncharacterized protein n=1 Tax=Marinactinospora thermotolerans DSM 45154 TaxID=1122192 RepID=A0A1T4LG14_9ACTN|nr:hypothetical protein SAMN02745673_00659 [Marinactinospora thermotolerans DSM 45154]
MRRDHVPLHARSPQARRLQLRPRMQLWLPERWLVQLRWRL